MSLDNFYSLRNNFLVVGLTGRTGGGCNDVCDFLKSSENPFKNISVPQNLHINEIQKFNICKNILNDSTNEWRKFSVIKYRDILLLFFLEELQKKCSNDFSNLNLDLLINLFNRLYNLNQNVTRRLGQDDLSDKIVQQILRYLKDNISELISFDKLFDLLKSGVSKKENLNFLNDLFFNNFSVFAKGFFEKIDKIDIVARQLFLQDIACNLRSSGHITFEDNNKKRETESIFTVAVAIKNIIKLNRGAIGWNRIIIDSLKNSLEINFFRERYSGFYLIASSRDEQQANEYLKNKIEQLGFSNAKLSSIIDKIKEIDNAHYQIKDFKAGKFSTPDLENCIQKADYYIYNSKDPEIEPIKYESENYRYLNLEMQLLKFLALIYKPGIITPSAIERSMQVAFSSKYNSGCISRQVGAVVTDSSYSVKSLGWNEVPQGQTPCSLRSLKELALNQRINVYSDYEKNGGNYSGKTFKEKVKETLIDVYGEEDNFFNNLNGHNCPYCFKDFHNAFEGKENQVHTRSLHAEENAMLQISKFGGQPLHGGILFTTASPCELCSKKAFQLGIKKVFYIDPYPGIAKEQILKAGNEMKTNPELFLFQGAVGRGYFKLYEPYMSIKDETFIRTNIKPQVSEDKLFKSLKEQLLTKFPESKELENISTYKELVQVIEIGLKTKK
ncbi:hypothetical protein [Sphingobacterium spiritivorum]|uniref:hypothetical protein n=1 Tax=Sphingobacterium spiritivorum TaxID=258 RepID=UPI00191919B4|nr:hypothetical protein [Sphingobacterium spiritivorum]QQT27525.1 hypothetical protein I6J02_06670 [Sphingobacterium spiritivorum]